MQRSLVLASNSPRRRELLRQIGLDFTTDPADVDETVRPGEPPERYAGRVAVEKARTAAARSEGAVVIGADTIVVVDDEILGKPADDRDAERMLRLLSGRMHRVITAVAVIDPAQHAERTAVAVTKVWFRSLDAGEIAAYIASGEPRDKAGAYGIQGRGALLVEKIEGCYFNVVGLPLSLLGAMLREVGFDLLKQNRR